VSKLEPLATLRRSRSPRYNAPAIRTSVCCPTKVRTALGDGMEDHPDPFFTPNLMPVQVGQAIVDVFDSGLSQYVIMPEIMRILPWMRAVPDWMRRLVNLVSALQCSCRRPLLTLLACRLPTRTTR